MSVLFSFVAVFSLTKLIDGTVCGDAYITALVFSAVLSCLSSYGTWLAISTRSEPSERAEYDFQDLVVCWRQAPVWYVIKYIVAVFVVSSMAAVSSALMLEIVLPFEECQPTPLPSSMPTSSPTHMPSMSPTISAEPTLAPSVSPVPTPRPTFGAGDYTSSFESYISDLDCQFRNTRSMNRNKSSTDPSNDLASSRE